MKFLFITHESSRTGAPIVLLQLVQWLKNNKPQVQCDMLSLMSGPLDEDFETAVHSYFKKEKTKVPKSWGGRIKRKLFKPKSIIDIVAANDYELIYANTVISLATAIEIKKQQTAKTKLICHVHELSVVIQTKIKNFKEQIHQADKIIAASNAVLENLISNYGVTNKKVNIIYEFSNITKLHDKRNIKDKEDFVVGGAGTVNWRKGPDVFIQVARYLTKMYPSKNIKFKWVGFISPQDQIIYNEDLRKLGLSEKVDFVGEHSNPLEHYQQFDVFLLSSREDPFPLVAIEIAQLAIPIICFEGASGTIEILTQGGGVIVPYLDTEAMAEAIIRYYDSSELKEKDGKIAQNNFSRFKPELICPEIYSVLEAELT